MTEWWQQGDDDVPAPVPRRDSIQETPFSDPRDVTSSPEWATFIPEWRQKRRLIAIAVTAAAFGLMVILVVDTFRAMSALDRFEHASGAGRFIGHIVEAVIASAVVVWVWRWANQRDPRDQRRLRS